MNMSKGEEKLAILLTAHRIAFDREFKFHPDRKWRFDFVIGNQPLDLKIAIEIEGGIFSNGRHTRGQGFMNDMIKYNEAIMLGWKVLRYATNQIDHKIIEQVNYLIDSQRSERC